MSYPPSVVDIKAVAFDVFGTIAEIQQARKPYAALLRHLRNSGREANPLDGAILMSNNLGLAEAAQHFGVVLAADILAALEQDLRVELMSIRLFPDALPEFERLVDAGFKVAVCSNLAAPYAQPIKSLVPFSLDAYVWSFEVGAIKPAPAMYDHLCHSLGCSPGEVLMVGDTLAADYDGPRKFGMRSIHLSRHRRSQANDNIGSLAELANALERLTKPLDVPPTDERACK